MIYKLFGTGSVGATVDGIASLDIQEDGIITAIAAIITATGMDASGDLAKIEGSFMSSNTFAVNDTRGSLITVALAQNFLTTGGGVGSPNLAFGGLTIPIEAGERVFMHAIADAGVTPSGTIYLYVEDLRDVKGQRPKARRR